MCCLDQFVAIGSCWAWDLGVATEERIPGWESPVRRSIECWGLGNRNPDLVVMLFTLELLGFMYIHIYIYTYIGK